MTWSGCGRVHKNLWHEKNESLSYTVLVHGANFPWPNLNRPNLKAVNKSLKVA